MWKVCMFDSKPYDKESFERRRGEDMEITYFETKLDRNTVRLARGYDAAVIFVSDTANAEVVCRLAAGGVRLLALRCAGFNHVDLRAADRCGLSVVRVPSYSPQAVAEHTMALLLTSLRRIHKAYNRTKEFNFSIVGLTGKTLHGKTMGVIGAGKIGRAFIRLALGFGMRVLAYDLHPSPMSGVEFVSLDTLFGDSDILSLHCPLTAENKYLISAATIAKMKPGVILLNTSRGALIQSEDLIEGIKSRKIGAACLDVYEEEGEVFFEDKSGHILHDNTLARLLSMPNVIVTSHQAFLTEEALDAIAQTTVGNIRSFFEDGVCQNKVPFA